jgi:hypothetical protein
MRAEGAALNCCAGPSGLIRSPFPPRADALHYRCIQNPYFKRSIPWEDITGFDKLARTDVRSLHNLTLSEVYEAAVWSVPWKIH